LGPVRAEVTNEYYEVFVHAKGLVRIVRSNTPFVSEKSVEQACAPIQLLLDGLDRPSVSLLIDSRNGPFRNDPEYERWFRPHRIRMVSGLRRVAILMRSAVGKLHAERMTRTDRTTHHVQVFTDADAALAYLMEYASPSRVRPRAR
jgi:hypothetical protein